MLWTIEGHSYEDFKATMRLTLEEKAQAFMRGGPTTLEGWREAFRTGSLNPHSPKIQVTRSLYSSEITGSNFSDSVSDTVQSCNPVPILVLRLAMSRTRFQVRFQD